MSRTGSTLMSTYTGTLRTLSCPTASATPTLAAAKAATRTQFRFGEPSTCLLAPPRESVPVAPSTRPAEPSGCLQGERSLPFVTPLWRLPCIHSASLGPLLSQRTYRRPVLLGSHLRTVASPSSSYLVGEVSPSAHRDAS